MVHDPLSPSEVLRTRAGAALAVVSLLVFGYSLVIAQLLLGALVGGALPAGLYLSYRFFAALDSLADAAQRIAAAREREADRESGFGDATRRESTASESSADALAERER
ncbi:MAG: hypothetical protein R6U01_06970 [Halorubrum sp.]|uniref:hypothetical protein n=1 Tax=Halorubrum sp. TaxID=1879286 RepID=UPI003970F0FF